MLISVCEIFHSIQGETSCVGLPATFIRLAGCNLTCSWCDTLYSHNKYAPVSMDDILKKVKSFDPGIVVVTGGEPLVQSQGTHVLLSTLCNAGYSVLLETNGSLPIKDVDPRVKIIIDVKCPGSNVADYNYWGNFDYLKADDEVKFTIVNRADFEWALKVIDDKTLFRFHLLMTPVFDEIKLSDFAEWIKESKLKNIRMNLQIHKIIWNADTGGV